MLEIQPLDVEGRDATVVPIIVMLNFLIALLCLYTALRVWQLRGMLANVADVLTIVERNTHRVLHHAPRAIIQGQMGTSELRQQYQKLTLQLLQVQQLLSMLSWGQGIWRQCHRSYRNHSTRRSPVERKTAQPIAHRKRTAPPPRNLHP